MAPQSGQCPYCQLIDSPQQLLVVDETDNFYAWLEINPRAKGHTQVVPKEHVESVTELGEDEFLEMARLVRRVILRAENGLDADGVSVTMNVKEAGGQMLPHAYVSVFPRFGEDENAGTPTGAIFPQREELQQELQDIREAMAETDVSSGEERREVDPQSQVFRESGGAGGFGNLLDGEDEVRTEEAEGEEVTGKESGSLEEGDGGQDEGESTGGSVDLSELSDSELLQELVSRHGDPDDVLTCEEFSSLMESSDYRLVRKPDNREESFEWM